MKKGAFLFWSLFSAVIVFTLGVQFAYSQSNTPFLTNPPSSGVWHNPGEIVCADCITSANLATGSVNAGEITDGAIADADVSNNAGIFSRKINGANGWHFLTSQTSLPNSGTTWTSLSTPGSMGMSNWAGSFIEIMCDSASSSGRIIATGGQGLGGILRYNHNVLKLNLNVPVMVYQATDGVRSQELWIRTVNNGANLEFSRTYIVPSANPTFSANEPEISNYECMIKVLSLCYNGPSGGASCS